MRYFGTSSQSVTRWLTVCAVVGLAACSGAPKKPDPKPLLPIASVMPAHVAWKHNVGKVDFPLSVAAQGDLLALADSEGSVHVLRADTGQAVWQVSVGAPLSAALGFDGRFAAAVTASGDVIGLQSSGVLWRQPLGIQVQTAPLVAGARVFVLASDRSVHAFDAQDGRKLWSVKRQGDPLTLLHPGLLRAFGDTLVVGQGSRMLGLNPLSGDVLWEASLASPRGTNEIERLADLVSPSARVGDLICARSFQVAVGCVNAARATLAWNKNFGGFLGVAADADRVYAADASDRISAWTLSNGAAAWSADDLLNHGLSAPAVAGKILVFGDERGMVHLLSKDDGRSMARLETDGSAIIGAPVVSGSTVVVVTRKGGVFALQPD